MEEIAALIAAIVDAFSKRSENKGSGAVGQLRQALAERTASPRRVNATASNRPTAGVPGLSAARELPGGAGVGGAPGPPSPPGQAGASLVQATQGSAGAPLSAAARRPDASQGPAFSSAAGSANREAGLVVGLFATPQSLAAAFIAAEILAPPLALREH